MAAPAAFGQGTSADYDRADKMPALTRNTVFRASVTPHWSNDGDRFWYRVDLANGEREFVTVDTTKGKQALSFDHDKLAAALSQRTEKSVSAKSLPIDDLNLVPAGDRVFFTAFGKRWELLLPSHELREAKNPEIRDTSRSTLTPAGAIGRTRKTGPETTIEFVNRRDRAVEILWIDTEGNRKSYGTIAAGGDKTIQTYAGHAWLVLDPGREPIASVEAVEGGGRFVIDGATRLKADGKSEPRRPGASRVSPDGKWEVLLKGRDLVLRNRDENKDVELTSGGTTADGYDGTVYWRPDSTRFVALKTQPGENRKVHMIEARPRDQFYPKLHTITYAKPGDKIATVRPHLFDVASAREIPVSDELFRSPWSIDRFHWDAEGKELRFLFNERGHQNLRLLAVDGTTGRVRTIVDEASKSFIDYAHKLFLRELEDTGEILWMSERSGWNHLYLIDAATGRVKNAITSGDWLVRGVDKVDVKARQIWFRAGGIHPHQDPYHIHFCRVNFDGTGLVVLTHGDGTHSIQHSPCGRFIVDTYSRVDLPPVTELRRTSDGSLVCELERADISALVRTGWKSPERFVAKGRDGKTDIHGIIFRPTTFDPNKLYPVIEAIYAGPQGSFVPKEFRALHRHQALAELGFVIVQIDGMGTSNRSRAFHEVCWKNLSDSGFPDRILWMKAAARDRPWMNLKKVGIFGGSAGGQSALAAVLHHGDFYYAAAADCGCHDNAIDKIWWNELWMGYPLGPQYREQSNETHAHKLTGKLFLTVGELDRNVDPASTMRVVDALVKAGKDFDLLVVPGADHGVGESAYAARRRSDFFVRHLLGVAPPDRNEPRPDSRSGK